MIEEFAHVPVFDAVKQGAFKPAGLIDENTLIDYQISFEFKRSMYNMFAESVTNLISSSTLSCMVREARKKQRASCPDLQQDEGEMRNNIKEWILQNKFIIGSESAQFWKIYEDNRAFRERLFALFEVYDKSRNYAYMYYEIRKIFDDFKRVN